MAKHFAGISRLKRKDGKKKETGQSF